MIQARRQPGSIFKPFVYTAALLNNYHAASIINDAPIVKFDDALEHLWRPENYGGRYNGPTRLRKGLYQSTNYIAIRILDSMGVGTAIRELDRFGFDTSAFPRDLTVALGSHALTPMEITRAYAVFANGGHLIEPHFIERVEDADGNVLFEARPLTVCRECENLKILETLGTNVLTEEAEAVLAGESLEALQLAAAENNDGFPEEAAIELLPAPESIRPPAAPRVLDERTAYIMDNILRDVVKEGTGRRARSLGRNDLAGKTGTTNDSIDTWFAGYNQSIVATTWMGFDNNSTLGRNEQGSNSSLPIWIEFMQTALKGAPELYPEQPPGIVTVRINSKTGLRTDANDPDAMFEVFRAEEVPPRGDGDFAIPGEDSEGDPNDLF